jgi:hypothetical protein
MVKGKVILIGLPKIDPIFLLSIENLKSYIENRLGRGYRLGGDPLGGLGSDLRSCLGSRLLSCLRGWLGGNLGSSLGDNLGDDLRSKLGSWLGSGLGGSLGSNLGSRFGGWLLFNNEKLFDFFSYLQEVDSGIYSFQ